MKSLHISTEHIFQNEKTEEYHFFTFLKISLVAGLLEDTWILLSAS